MAASGDPVSRSSTSCEPPLIVKAAGITLRMTGSSWTVATGARRDATCVRHLTLSSDRRTRRILRLGNRRAGCGMQINLRTRMASLFLGVTRMTDITPRVLEFSTKGVPEKDKAAYWREHYGQVMLRVDLEPAPDRVFEATNRCLYLPGLQLLEGSSSPAKISRSGQYLADGNDDVVLSINRSGSVLVTSSGRECSLNSGEAIVLSCDEAGSYHRTSAGTGLAVRVPRTMFDSTVVSIDDALMRRIPADHSALKLMEDYASWVLNAGSIDHQLLNLSVRHIQDLLALTIGPTADFADTA